MSTNVNIASVCKSDESKTTSRQHNGSVHNVCNEEREESDELDRFSVETVMSEHGSKCKVNMSLKGFMCELEIDTAADRSIMSKSTSMQNFSRFPFYQGQN